ncbi:MAG: hypothetical protein WBA76_12580 [Phormidesmis sp.]
MESTIAIAVIDSAVRYLQADSDKPMAKDVVSALLAAERQSKQAKRHYQYDQLLGSWRLGFVSGTQKVRPSPSSTPVTKPGKGRFLPRFLSIEITYAQEEATAADDLFGTVENAVTLGPINLQLDGPTRFWPRSNSLGFDFTALQAKLGSLPLYAGSIRGGAERNSIFKTQALKDQAFFTFFTVEADCLAARGKGGGLALWVRSL